MPQQPLTIEFPIAGLDRAGNLPKQPPYTTPAAANVGSYDPAERRVRGGSRPGIARAPELHALGTSHSAPRLLLPHYKLDAYTNPDALMADEFENQIVSALWGNLTDPGSGAPYISMLTRPLAEGCLVFTSADGGRLLTPTAAVDTDYEQRAMLQLIPYRGGYAGKVRLFCQLNDLGSDRSAIEWELDLDAVPGQYRLRGRKWTAGVQDVLWEQAAGVAHGGYPLNFRVTWTAAGYLVWINGTLTYDHTTAAPVVPPLAATRVRVGFSALPTGGTPIRVDYLRHGYRHEDHQVRYRKMLILAENGHVYRETYTDTLEKMTGATRLVGYQAPVQAAELNGQLYFSDADPPLFNSSAHIYTTFSLPGGDPPITNVLGTDDFGVGVAPWDPSPLYASLSVGDLVLVEHISSVGGNPWPVGAYKVLSKITYNHAAAPPGSPTKYYFLELTAAAGGPYDVDTLARVRIVKPLSRMDLMTGTVAECIATDGAYPHGALITTYRGRLVIAGPGEQWYMSRQNDALDWNYAPADPNDPGRPIAGHNSVAGKTGEAIRALIGGTDDYLIFGCEHSVWRLVGDPAYGGALHALSRAVGMLSAYAWCMTPEGLLVFASPEGIFRLSPGGGGYPEPLSRRTLPKDLLFLLQRNTQAFMAWDPVQHGALLFLSVEGAPAPQHWWLDPYLGAFWPITVPSAWGAPTAIGHDRDGNVLIGWSDGRLRRVDPRYEKDDGTQITSYVYVGPFGGHLVGSRVLTLDAALATGSGPVRWSILPGETAEEAQAATAEATGVWTAGRNPTDRPRTRTGRWFLKLANADAESAISQRWMLESLIAMVEPAGRMRVL